VQVSLSEQLVAAKELAERVLPAHLSKRISFLPLKVESGSKDVWDAFELESPSRGHLQVFASSGVAAASGLRYFLSRFARASISWGRDGTGVNVAHLDKLPTLEGRVRKQTKQKYRYYFNAVTFGYSSAFWDWERWQIEIDWAAMHGINLFLALEGQEYVWEKLWKEMGVSQVRCCWDCAVVMLKFFFEGGPRKVFSWPGISGLASHGSKRKRLPVCSDLLSREISTSLQGRSLAIGAMIDLCCRNRLWQECAHWGLFLYSLLSLVTFLKRWKRCLKQRCDEKGLQVVCHDFKTQKPNRERNSKYIVERTRKVAGADSIPPRSWMRRIPCFE
jgi:hypothetical protein